MLISESIFGNNIFLIYTNKKKMIISKTVFIKVNNRYVKYYKSKGYQIKGGDIIEVKIDDLTANSNVLIEISCDYCADIKKVGYNAYNRYTKNQTEEYYCQKCNNIKRMITVQEMYGTNNVFQSNIIKEKRKNTMIKEYGNEHALNIQIFKEKAKETNRNNFGCNYASQNDDIKNKIKGTFMKNYGVSTSLLNPETQEKIENTNLKKYGVKNVYESSKFKSDKIFIKYGVRSPMHIDWVKEKIKKTNLERYGTENSMSNETIKAKMIKTKQINGIYMNDCDRPEFENYRLKVKSITNKNKKALLINWDGYDYYDGEYIKENYKFGAGSNKYPTIDHKVSVKFGFDNKIPPEEISKIDNLCITKRGINSSKGQKNV